MKTKIVFASATALGLLMATGAHADNNKATVQQSGNNNTALAEQDGGGNFLGVPNSHTTYGYVKQLGDNNNLDVLQTGAGNDIAHWNGGTTSNVIQNGNLNSLSITEHNDSSTDHGNAVHGVYQTSNGGVVNTNTLTIVQNNALSVGRTQNVVGVVNQTNTGYVSNAIYGNTIDILQRENDATAVSGIGFHMGNVVKSVTQTGYSHSLDIDEIGVLNFLGTTTQTGVGNNATVYLSGTQNALTALEQSQSGASGDTAIVHLDGINNGVGSAGSVPQWAPWTIPTPVVAAFTASSPASAVAGVFGAQVHQTGGGGNYLSYFVTGNYNLYAFSQNGTGNHLGGTVNGDSHEAAVNQDGDGNVVDFLQSGTGNNLGVWIDGGDNHLNIKQVQSGASGNLMSVSITGNNNNNYPVTAALTGDALTVKGFAVADVGTFGQGDLFQNGSNNSLTFTVTNSDLNAFATDQHGNDNTIVHTISGGNGNQIVVAQLGNTNTSVTAQVGSGNNIGVKQ